MIKVTNNIFIIQLMHVTFICCMKTDYSTGPWMDPKNLLIQGGTFPNSNKFHDKIVKVFFSF